MAGLIPVVRRVRQFDLDWGSKEESHEKASPCSNLNHNIQSMLTMNWNCDANIYSPPPPIDFEKTFALTSTLFFLALQDSLEFFKLMYVAYIKYFVRYPTKIIIKNRN